MALYVIYYLIMKYYHIYILHRKEESLSWTCWVYFLLGATFAVAGMYFFSIQEKTTLVSPAASRHLNHKCTLWFFDKHDIWHFASAFGLLFTFLALLTIEDNNTATPWKNIPVFWSPMLRMCKCSLIKIIKSNSAVTYNRNMRLIVWVCLNSFI